MHKVDSLFRWLLKQKTLSKLDLGSFKLDKNLLESLLINTIQNLKLEFDESTTYSLIVFFSLF